MDAKTLAYMAERVDDGRRIVKQIAKLRAHLLAIDCAYRVSVASDRRCEVYIACGNQGESRLINAMKSALHGVVLNEIVAMEHELEEL